MNFNNSKPKLTAIIPIRGGSKRCPNKSIRKFNDTTLLELRINKLKKTKGIDIIQVNSDCDIILNKARELGVDTFKREAIYGSDEADGKMVYKCLSEACPTENMLIAFTPTPFIDETDYEKCIEIFNTGECDSVISVNHKKEYLFYNKKPVNFNPLRTCRSQDLPKYYNMTFGVTIVKTDFVKKNHSIWTPNPYFYEVDELKSMDIDTSFDFFLCEQIYKKGLNDLKSIEDFVKNSNDIHKTEYISESENVSENVSHKFHIPDDVYLGAVYDALNELVDDATKFVLNIKPCAGYKHIIHGPAFTISTRNVTKEDKYDEIDMIRYQHYKKDLFVDSPIIMLEMGNDQSSIAHFGDITCRVYKKLGAAGLVTDGIGRDIDLIDKLDFPVFCKDINPIDAFEKWAYVDHSKPVFLENKCIYPGDYVFADNDGIIVVPKNMMSDFIPKLNNVLIKEREIRSYIDSIPLENMDVNISNFVRKKGRF